MPHPRPFRREGRLQRVLPFIAAAVLPLALLPLDEVERPGTLVAAGVLLGVLVASVFLVPWDRLPGEWQALPPLGYFVVVALLREGAGPASGYAALVLLPVLWFALYGTRTEMWASLGGLALTLGVPIIALEGYDTIGQVRNLLLLLTIGVLVGPTTQGLVVQVRRRAAEAAEAQAIAHLGSWTFDTGTDDVTWSDEFARILGLEPGAVKPSFAAFQARVHPDDRPLAPERLAIGHQDGTLAGLELRIVRPSGEVRTVVSRGTLDPAGRRYVGTLHDVTERKESEQRLADQAVELERRRQRRRQVVEINDEIIQGLVVTLHDMRDTGVSPESIRAVEDTLARARRLVDDLLGDAPVRPGDLRRGEPAL